MKIFEAWDQVTYRLLTRFTHRPKMNRTEIHALIGALVGVIGVVDHLTGIRVNMLLFYLVPISLAVAWTGWRGGLVTALASAVARLLGDVFFTYPAVLPFYLWWNMVAAMVTYSFLVGVLHALIGLYRKMEERVRERTCELHDAIERHRQLERELLEVSARERSAVGRELHDELGQHLVATALAAQVLAQRLRENDRPYADDAQAIVRWTEEGIAKTRRMAQGLLREAIQPDRLPGELAELTGVAGDGGVRCVFRHEGRPVAVDPAACAQLFRIAQEAVTNALRHARCGLIDMRLVVDEATLHLTVADNGCGMPASAGGSRGLGQAIMRHRASVIGGALDIISAPGEGTRVICRVPAASRSFA